MVHSAPAAKLVPQLFANINELAFVPVTAILVIVTVAVPVLVITTVCDALSVATSVEGNVRLLADRVTGAFSPVPLSAIVCGEPFALSVMVTAAIAAPLAVGAKCPWMEQFAPTASIVPQLLANKNSVAFVPVTAMLVNVSAAVPLLVSVTDCDALLSPTVVAGNVRLVADSVTGPTPVPFNAIVCGEPAALSVKVRFATAVPACVGAKDTLRMQLVSDATVVPQGLESLN